MLADDHPPPPSAPLVPTPAPAPSAVSHTLAFAGPTMPSSFFIVHDGENAPIPPDSHRGHTLYEAVVREAARLLCGSVDEGFKPLSLPRGAVTWMYVTPIRRWCREGMTRFAPRGEVLRDLEDVGGVTCVDAGDKPGRTDVKVMELLNEFLFHHRHDSPAVRRTCLVVLLSGDRDFLSSLRAISGEGFPVVVIHCGEGRESIGAVCAGVSGEWGRLVGGSIRPSRPLLATAPARAPSPARHSPTAVPVAAAGGEGGGGGGERGKRKPRGGITLSARIPRVWGAAEVGAYVHTLCGVSVCVKKLSSQAQPPLTLCQLTMDVRVHTDTEGHAALKRRVAALSPAAVEGGDAAVFTLTKRH